MLGSTEGKSKNGLFEWLDPRSVPVPIRLKKTRLRCDLTKHCECVRLQRSDIIRASAVLQGLKVWSQECAVDEHVRVAKAVPDIVRADFLAVGEIARLLAYCQSGVLDLHSIAQSLSSG